MGKELLRTSRADWTKTLGGKGQPTEAKKQNVSTGVGRSDSKASCELQHPKRRQRAFPLLAFKKMGKIEWEKRATYYQYS